MARYKRISYHRWLKRFFIFFLSLLALVALFNLLADGVGIFRLNAGLKQVATNLLAGKMVAGRFSTFDERELQRLIVEQYKGRRDIIAIGSSRTMSLREKFFPRRPNFFNHSTSGALLGDMAAVIGLYRSKGVLPGTVILGIDPWIFNTDNGLGRPWETLSQYCLDMMKVIDENKRDGNGKERKVDTPPKVDRTARVRQLINLDYTLQNWKALRKGKRMRPTTTAEIDDFVREPDGSIHFPYQCRHSKMGGEGPANFMPDSYFNNFNAFYGTEILEGLVQYLQSRGVRVVFLLPPFHPRAYRAALEVPKYHVTLQVEDYLRGLARKKGITVIGSYDPAPYGFKGEDFFDGTHGHPNVMERLFKGYK
ncbi:MAG TPA: hypothetical protein VGJ94_07035 [Syntrophorhabdaceae bacterium]